MRVLTLYLSVLLSVSACTTKGSSTLSDALSEAVKEKKISARKMESILSEHERISDQDKLKGREYVNQVVGAIEMGGDSTHIDAARRNVLGKIPEKKV